MTDTLTLMPSNSLDLDQWSSTACLVPPRYPDAGRSLWHRPQMKLSSKLVENIKPAKKRIELRDALLPSFGLRVAVSGRKSWFVVGRVHGRQKRVTIGSYPAMSLHEARKAASEIIVRMQMGTYESQLSSSGLTFEDAAREFIIKHAKPKNRGWRTAETVLRKFAKLDRIPLAAIKRQDVVRVLDDIVAAGTPIRANRALAAIKKLFAWALDRGMIDVHPVAGLKPPAKEVSRDRVLTDAELRALWAAVPAPPFGPIIKLLLLTAQRVGEVSAMRWSDIDFERKVWTIPASVAKNGKSHEVPLAPVVIDIFQHLLPEPGMDSELVSEFVFTTTRRTSVSGFGKVKSRLDVAMNVFDWRLHDLRRTAASGMARLGTAPHVIERTLNHASGQISGVALVYNRHAYNAEKRHALELWADYVMRLI